jgi:hypothetical protein
MRAMTLWTEQDKDVPFLFVVPQGSWQPETPYSGTTHTDAGVEDLWFDGIGDNDKSHMVARKLRGRGRCTGYLRGPKAEFGNYSMWHYHCCDFDTHGMDPNAQWQVGEFWQGNDGLVAGRNDPLPWRPDDRKPFDFRAWQKYLETRHDLRKTLDRIDTVGETLEDLRDQRDQLKRIIRRQLVERIS